MRISELSSQTGIPVATIKFYLREGLLQEGVRTSATQAQYDEGHVARLRLIRALLGPGGLSVAAAHRVIQAIEKPPPSVHELLGVAASAVARPSDGTEGQPRAAELLRAGDGRSTRKTIRRMQPWRTLSGHSTRQVSSCLRERSMSMWSTCIRSRSTRSTTSRLTHRPPRCDTSCWAPS